MFLERTMLSEGHGAHITSVRLDTNVRLLMCFQITPLCKRFVTHVAFVWFGTGVCTQMVLQIPFLRKRFRTEGTSKRFVTCVGARVHREVAS